MIRFLAPPPTGVSGGYRYNEAILEAWPAWAPELHYEFVTGESLETRANAPLLLDSLLFNSLQYDKLREVAQRLPVALMYHHMPSLEPQLSEARRKALVRDEVRRIALCRLVITSSRFTARYVRRNAAMHGYRPPRVVSVYPGVDNTAENSLPDKAPKTLAPSGARSFNQPVQILSVGALTPRKGQLDLCRALAGCRHLGWQWNIVGESSQDGTYTHRLLEEAGRSGIRDRITLRGATGPAELLEFYHGADLFALPSRFETYGMVFAEALQAGVPVLARAVGGVPEVVTHRKSGLLVRNSRALRGALQYLLSDHERRADLAEGAGKDACSLPRWPEQAQRFAKAVACLEKGSIP